MSKVFRLHNGIDGNGWFLSKPLTKDDLKTIKTEGKDVATSIPSPFARIDLVKSAFRWVADNGIDGKTAQHKLVSDALDVAQLFYSSPRYKDKIEIEAWNPIQRFDELVNSNNTKHTKFAETLKIYWEQDSVPVNDKGDRTLYNFEHVKRLYFILNKETRQVIGGTSPSTLFLSAPDVKKVTTNLNITCGQHKLFGKEYASLAKREASFVEYMFSLSKQPNFPTYFPEVYAYLDEVRLNNLESNLRSKVTNLDEESLDNYPICPVLENSNDPCEILGIQIGVQIINGSSIENESDFVIKSDLPIPGQKPLVLPNDKFSKEWTYTTHGINWDENTQVPVKNSKIPNDSILPIQENQYYWLSIENFLEDKIIELPYTIDAIKFNTCKAKNHLLPLTPTFFKYFNTEKVSEYLKLEGLSGGGIEAKLEIPVKGGKISYKKTYHQADIVKLELHLAVLPFFRAPKVDVDYTLGIIDDRIDKNGEFSIMCYENGTNLQIDSPIIRNPGIDDVKSYYYKSSNKFDLIRVGIQSFQGFIVPIFHKCSGGNKINFAIDFGTTNTHIEYVLGENVATPLDNNAELPIWQSLMNRKDKFSIDSLVFDREETFEKEMFPYLINNETLVHFPLRTALVHNSQVNFNDNIDIYRHVNNYLLFEKRNIPLNYLQLQTQLKWSNYADSKDEKKVECYIESLVTLVFYKTLLLNGDIDKTTITWFYPVSMDEGELSVFFKLWKQVYNKVFKLEATEDTLKGIPESIAPYLFYKSSVEGLSLSIDIGGGSSDIAVFDEDEEKAKIISSFKFAGNAIFGDGYPSNEYKSDSDRNGFVKSFLTDAYKAVEGDEQKISILDSIINKRKDSADFSSYLFTLEKDKEKPFSYTRLLEKNKRMKLAIFVYYGAIAYYSANLLKKSDIGIPKYILLSGTASKTASILDSSKGFRNLTSMFQFIFEKVFKEESKADMIIKLSPIPKEITCKGALKGNLGSNISGNPIKFWIGGIQNNEWGNAVDKERDITKTPKYKEIEHDEKLKSQIEDSIITFYSILDEYVINIRLESKYVIESEAYEIFKKVRSDGIRDFLIRGIKAYYKKEDEHIEETLFFYPLIGMLNKLAFKLSEKLE